MPWEYILSSISGAGLALVLSLIFIKKAVEKSVDSQFDIRLESFKAKQSKALESEKTELDIWASLRKDILTDVWNAHRAIINSMGNVLKAVQEPFALLSYEEMERTLRHADGRSELAKGLNESIKQFRDINRNNVDLVSEDASAICQKFFDEAFELAVMLSSPPEAIDNKEFNFEEIVRGLATDLVSKDGIVEMGKEKTENITNKLNELIGATEAPKFLPRIVALREQRTEFYRYVVAYFGLEEIMPWMIHPKENKKH